MEVAFIPKDMVGSTVIESYDGSASVVKGDQVYYVINSGSKTAGFA